MTGGRRVPDGAFAPRRFAARSSGRVGIRTEDRRMEPPTAGPNHSARGCVSNRADRGSSADFPALALLRPHRRLDRRWPPPVAALARDRLVRGHTLVARFDLREDQFTAPPRRPEDLPSQVPPASARHSTPTPPRTFPVHALSRSKKLAGVECWAPGVAAAAGVGRILHSPSEWLATTPAQERWVDRRRIYRRLVRRRLSPCATGPLPHDRRSGRSGIRRVRARRDRPRRAAWIRSADSMGGD